MIQQKEKQTRIDVADVLRGLAVMGIIVLHAIEHFNFSSYPDKAMQSDWLNFMDKAIWDGLFFTFGGKAYAVFALLFGFSFYIQDNNQRMRGKDFRLRFCWRLVLLFVLGNINAIFFTAEVLVLYSLVGFILPLVCRLKEKWLWVLAGLLLIQPLPLYYVIRACIDPAFTPPRHTYKRALGSSFRDAKQRNIPRNHACKLVGRTIGQPGLGMGSWPGISNSGSLLAWAADRASRTVLEREYESVEQSIVRCTCRFLPLIRIGQYASRFHRQ